MSKKSPLANRGNAREYAKQGLREWAAENIADGAAVFAIISIDEITDGIMADWDERMTDPRRRLPNGEPPDKRRQLDHAVHAAITRTFL